MYVYMYEERKTVEAKTVTINKKKTIWNANELFKG